MVMQFSRFCMTTEYFKGIKESLAQIWISVLLATYGGAVLIGSREFHLVPREMQMI